MQSKKTVSAYFTSEQILHFGLAEQRNCGVIDVSYTSDPIHQANTKFTFFKLNEKSSGEYLEQGTIMSSVSPDRENQNNTFFSTLNPLTAGAAYIWVLICISTLSTTF